MVVSVVKLQEPLESLRQAIELCGGFEGLGRNDKVLIKPNICLSEWMPLYGLVTTTSLLEGLVQLLVERGCHDISIGEGPVDILALSIMKRLQADGDRQRFPAQVGAIPIRRIRPQPLSGKQTESLSDVSESGVLAIFGRHSVN